MFEKILLTNVVICIVLLLCSLLKYQILRIGNNPLCWIIKSQSLLHIFLSVHYHIVLVFCSDNQTTRSLRMASLFDNTINPKKEDVELTILKFCILSRRQSLQNAMFLSNAQSNNRRFACLKEPMKCFGFRI